MSECRYSWTPPWQPPPHPRDERQQKDIDLFLAARAKGWCREHCALPKGHDGDHRSLNKVTTTNRRSTR